MLLARLLRPEHHFHARVLLIAEHPVSLWRLLQRRFLVAHQSQNLEDRSLVQPLPRERRASWVVTDASGLSSALEGELARIGVKKSRPTLLQALDATRRSFKREHLVELGIGCEACHLGAAEHVRDPKRLPSFEPRTSLFAVQWPAPAAEGAAQLRAARINRVCARCHQVLFSGYEPTWEGGARHGNAGGSHINSGEARDMLLGACASKLTCVECHDPHAPDATAPMS